MTARMCILSCVFALSLLSFGCVGSGTNQGGDTPPTAQGNCEAAYAYAPGAYIINIVSGDAVILDPTSNDFYLFCTPAEARKHLDKRIAEKALPPGDWKVYRVYGTWDELVTEISPGNFLLNVPAPIVDWVD